MDGIKGTFRGVLTDIERMTKDGITDLGTMSFKQFKPTDTTVSRFQKHELVQLNAMLIHSERAKAVFDCIQDCQAWKSLQIHSPAIKPPVTLSHTMIHYISPCHNMVSYVMAWVCWCFAMLSHCQVLLWPRRPGMAQ